jgi:hypothetical protein
LKYDYSHIDDSITDEAKNTFDTEVTLRYLFVILGVIGLMIIIGVAFDMYNLFHNSGKIKQNSSGTLLEPSFVAGFSIRSSSSIPQWSMSRVVVL